MRVYVNIEVEVGRDTFDQTRRIELLSANPEMQRQVLELVVERMIDNIFRKDDDNENPGP